MNVQEFMILHSLAANKDEIISFINNARKPTQIARKALPDSLNDLTMGELLQLQSMNNGIDIVVIPCSVLLGLSKSEVLQADAGEVLGLSRWVAKEIERINKLFEAVTVKPTPQEERAGIKNLNLGVFGMIDWYAQRMGITNHEEVESVPWVRVYKCMEIDAKKTIYQRRLQRVYNEERRHRR